MIEIFPTFYGDHYHMRKRVITDGDTHTDLQRIINLEKISILTSFKNCFVNFTVLKSDSRNFAVMTLAVDF